jgi:lipopolysaccharide biosynthesis glycosyltransferase
VKLALLHKKLVVGYFCSGLCFEMNFYIIICFFVSNLCLGTEKIEMHVLYCVENANSFQTTISIASLLHSTTEKEEIHLHFVGEGLSEKNLNKILLLKNKIRPFTLEWASFDLSRLKEFETERWNKKVMVKLFAAEIFPDLDRMLWLDDDVLILKNIRMLFERDMEGKYTAVVDASAVYREHYPVMDEHKCDYWLTSGVCVFNLDLIRKEKAQILFIQTARSFSKKIPSRKNRCGGIEEYALTKNVNKNQTIILPYRYNVMTFFRGDSYEKAYEFEISNCIALHFAGFEKPWKRSRKRIAVKYLEIYQEYHKLAFDRLK